MKRRKGHEIDYAGKKYVSLHELCDDLDLPYSPLAHKYYRTKDIEQSVERAKKVKDAQTYTVWGREYKSLTDIAKEYGTSAAVISKRLQDGKTAEEAIAEIIQKETFSFCGKEFHGLAQIANFYGKDYSLVWERLKYSMSMEEALFLPIRQMNKPQYEITYRGKTYQSKRAFARENNIGIVCIREMMENHGVDFETAAAILLEIKEKAGIPAEQMITRFPMCMIRGKEYRTLAELAAELKISAAAVSTYKNRNGCGGILETLCQMQKEERETYFLDGRAVSYKELMQMGYTSVSYQTVPKKKIPLYPQLAGHDFVTGCVDVAKIYEEVKSERLEQEKGMQMNM